MVAPLVNLLKGAASLLLLPVTLLVQSVQTCAKTRLSERVRLILEIFAVAILVIALGSINWYLGLERFLVGPPALRKVWLGLIALLTYLTVRLLLAFLHQIPRSVTEFPDIRKAFRAGLDAIADARIPFRDTPLFLVVGAEPDAEAAFARSPLVAGCLDLAAPESPLHWFGKGDAIWISLSGISAISGQVVRQSDPNANDAGAAGVGSTQRLSVEEKETARRRLEYLVSLLREARSPVIPVNGLILMIPYAWIADPVLAQPVDVVKIDMHVLQRSLGVRCLCQMVVYGIESSSEFQAYVDRTPATERERRCGCTLPQFTSITDRDFDSLHEWISGFFRRQVFNFYATNIGYGGNGSLFRFLHEFEQSRQRFCRCLEHAFSAEDDEKFHLGGVYFAKLAKTGNVFFDGIVAKMLSEHDDVIGWSDRRIRADRRLLRLASAAAGLVVALLACDVILFGRWLYLTH